MSRTVCGCLESLAVLRHIDWILTGLILSLVEDETRCLHLTDESLCDLQVVSARSCMKRCLTRLRLHLETRAFALCTLVGGPAELLENLGVVARQTQLVQRRRARCGILV